MKAFRLLACFVITLALTPWSSAEEFFTPYHIAKLRSVSGGIISPDGTQVAYYLSIPRIPLVDEDGTPWRELHVMDLEGNSRPFITNHDPISGVAWTPDGKGISFLSKRGKDKKTSLYVIPINGGEARKVLEHSESILSYVWSPDGQRVAFTAKGSTDKKIKDLKKKGFKQEIYEEDWKPTMVWIATIGTEDAEPRSLDLEGSATRIRWNPMGPHLAIALTPTSLIDDVYMKQKVHIVHVDSGNVVARIDNPGKLGNFAWSPTGEHLAMISAADRHDPKEGRLMVVSSNGGELKDLLPGYLGHVSAFAWKNGQTLRYIGDEGVWTTFNEVDLGGTPKQILGTGGPILRSVTLSQNGEHAAFIGETPIHPNELFMFLPGDSNPRRLTDSNPWLANMRFAPQEVVTYKARDGLEIEGILIRPLEEQKGNRYPLILTVHGGPEAHYRNGWLTYYSMAGQTAAARGFAVFYPNYRASTGRGVEFSKLDYGDPAGKEFDDLVDGVDHLIATGLVHKDKVGVTGGSYGGYATAWCSTYYSERFAAGVMFVGISNKLSKAGTTDIPHEMYDVHDPHWPWDDWQFFLERSPIYYVEKAKTPLLIMHGKNDTRVHPGQSMELFRHLKVLGQTPVRLVFYPGEGHGNRRAGARLDYNLRLLRWMEHYLKGPGGPAPDYTLEYKKSDETEEIRDGSN